MGNEELRNRRKEVAIPQFLLAQRSGVTRMRLSAPAPVQGSLELSAEGGL